MTLFGPRITIFVRDGTSYAKQATGRELSRDFAEGGRRIRGVTPGLPISTVRFEEITVTCRDPDREARADRPVRLTLKDA